MFLTLQTTLACSEERAGDDAQRDAAPAHDDAATASAGSGTSHADAAAAAGSGAEPANDAGVACAQVELDVLPPFSDERALHPLAATPHAFFTITVVAAGSGTPLGGAVLRTVNHIALTADANGVIAFYEPGLMDQEVYFEPSYPGYERAADAFGFRGVRLQVTEGGSARVELTQVASAQPPVVSGDLQTRLAAGPVPGPEQCFALELRDRDSGRGVPLVRVELGGDGEAFWSDSNGLVAYCNPDRLGQRVGAQASSHGYEPASAMLEPRAGGTAVIELTRNNVAERLYRVTGQGIYRDSLLLGRDVPLQDPALDGEVVGQDTVQAAIYNGKLFWVWGDTNRPAYPLGNFHTSSALSQLPGQGGLPPSAGVDLDYFVDDAGFSRPMAPPESVPGPEGVTWLGPLFVVPDAAGRERLYARYARVKSGTLQADQLGLVRFDDERKLFEQVMVFDDPAAPMPDGHPTRVHHASGDQLYFQPPLRVAASEDAVRNPRERYEVWSAFEPGSERIARAPDGTLAYGWKQNTGYVTRAALQAAGIGAEQALDGHLRDRDGDERIDAHSATSRSWNAYRARFSEIVQQIGGESSFLGEIWYAEGDTPMGPWVYARKVVTHDDYTFYNPRQHPFFDQQGGRRIYFEGSYVTTFASDEAEPTPRYDYNQVMYRLDLDDPRLVLPVPVYAREGQPFELVTKRDVAADDSPLRASFFAPDRPAPGLIALAWSNAACNPRTLVASEPSAADTPPVFYALPAAAPAAERPAGALALHAYRDGAARVEYATEDDAPAGLERDPAPIAYVWPAPIDVRFPVAEFLGDLVAVAGPDRCTAVPAGRERATIELEASARQQIPARVARWLWTARGAHGCEQIEAQRASFELPAGTHLVRVDVWDDAGNHDSDTLLVDVAAP